MKGSPTQRVRLAEVVASLSLATDLATGQPLEHALLRYRYLAVPGLLVSSGRRLVLKLRRDYPLFARFLVALQRLVSLPLPAT